MIRALALALALAPALAPTLAAAPCQAVDPNEGAYGLPPGPKTRLAGLHGLRATSTVVFVSAPDRPHTLEACYAFPDRARWEMRLDGATNRMLEYRYGERFFRLEDAVRDSVEILGEQRKVQALRMELRRAALLWPDGLAWTGDGAERTAAVRARAAGPKTGPKTGPKVGPEIGRLVATLDDEGRPRELQARLATGPPLERLVVAGWIELEGRLWPERLTLYQGDHAVWTEDLRRIESRWRVKEGYFLPPDREDLRPGTDAIEAARPARTTRGVDLPQGASWETALGALAAERARLAPALLESGRELDPVAEFELDAEGRPVRAVLRLARTETPAPAGWTTTPRRPGRALTLSDRAQVDGDQVERLLDAIEPPARPGPPAVRFESAQGRVRLVVEVLPD